ncbi:L-threonylcarbamoyladenylate synthase [Crateriforma spongiae]|uniref:L-threonylcarbamoyladenylate synthase n=1 Tax=Crateriforma spongiae TaxID=2724528 RepID=UPI001F388C1A|nr:L-threonylcarbamoyladenylate synthase [Crateriforma spongiae]
MNQDTDPASLIHWPTDSAIRRAAAALAAGDLVGVPTETVYGLAADATRDDAVSKIYQAKGRPSTNPLIVHAADATAARRYTSLFVGDRHNAGSDPTLIDQWKIASAFWPGPLTVVVPRSSSIPDIVTAGRDTVAIRVPDHPVMRKLLKQCPFPLAAPSANVSNYVSPTIARHVADGLGQSVAMVLDGGRCDWGVESTIIQLDADGPRLLRPGGITAEQLRSVFGRIDVPEQGVNHSKAQVAPGQLPTHYSPDKSLVFVDRYETLLGEPSFQAPQRIGRIAFSRLDDAQRSQFDQVWIVDETGDLRRIASRLFAVLREADQSDCDLLVIDRCEEIGIGRAIMDRLRRATRSVDQSQ